MVERKFFTRSNTTNKPICIIEGKIGFFPVAPIDGSETVVDAKLAAANAVFGNTPDEILAAEGCSMFGWDIPLAKRIITRSNRI